MCPRDRIKLNRIPLRVRHRVVEAALADPVKSPRELAWQFTDRERHFLSESSVYRILKAEDLITRPAYVVLSAAKTFCSSDAPAQRVVANRLHLPAGCRVGLVLPVDRARRLLALHLGVDASDVDAGVGP